MRHEPAWVQDPRQAALAWSRLTEPSDVIAGKVRAHLGLAEVLARTFSDAPLPACAADEGPHSPACRRTAGARRDRELAQAQERWQSRLATLSPARDLDRAHHAGARLLVPEDEDWPVALDDLKWERPVLLWVRGQLRSAGGVALVGSRTCTGYGQRTASEFAAGLGGHGHDVISGAAFGIDAAAHRGALAVDAHTTAVLACGIDRAYPSAHTDLIDRIAAVGAVLSESPPGSTPTRWRFLQRNRLIAALAGATVVVEAAFRSGALSTAGHAHTVFRPVGAVPGPVTSACSAGSNQLIRDGRATLVTSVDDVRQLVTPIGAVPDVDPQIPLFDQDGLDPVDLRVWETLSPRRALTVAQLAVGSGLSQTQVRAVLGRLANEGRAERGRDAEGLLVWKRVRRR